MKSLNPRHLIGEARSVIADYDAASPHTSGRIKQAVGGLLVADGLVGLENPFDKDKNSRAGILGSLLIALFGALFIIVPLVVFSSGGPDTDATAVGQVTSVNTLAGNSCSYVGSFRVGTEVFSFRSTVNSTGHCNLQAGTPIEVDYLSIDPRVNKVANEYRGLQIFYWVGAIIVLCGLITFAIRATSIVFGRRLYSEGKRQAEANPPTPGDEGMVAAARERMLLILTGARADWASTAPKPGAVSPPPSAPSVQAGDIVSPVPGWYPTEDGTHLRWFDGGAWTAHVRPLPQQSSPQP